MERAKEILHGSWNAVRKVMAYASNNKHIKSALHKPYKEIKTPLSYLRDSATLFSEMNRGVILSFFVFLISYYYISTLNISFMTPSSFNALFIGTDLLYRNGHFIHNGLLKILEYAAVQLSMMPFVFYIVRKEQYKDKKFNYFAPFKEGVLWYAYASLIILFSISFVLIFSNIKASLFLLIICFIFKSLTVNVTYWMMELRIKRAPCIGLANQLYSYLFFTLISFTIFYITHICQCVLSLEIPDLSSWKYHFFLPFVQTFGLGIFLGLELLMFGTITKLIQNSQDNPSDFKESKEKALIMKQWRHYIKNECSVFKPITNTCLSLGGFFLCFYLFAEAALLQGGLLRLTELCNAPKTVNQWMPLFFLMLCSIPFLIDGTKILGPKNESRNYFSYFTLQKY